MKNYLMNLVYVLVIQLTLTSTVFMQNLINGAESIAYYHPTKSYYVSSLNNNRIVRIDENGERSVYVDGIIAFGNCIKSDVLYISSGTRVRGYNLLTNESVFDLPISGSRQLDGMAFADNGFLYVVESRDNKIFQVDVVNGTSQLFIDEGLEGATQDLIFDHINKRIIACAWQPNTYIVSINPNTAEIKKLVNSVGRFDGVTIDEDGFFYFGTYSDGGKVIKYDNNFKLPPIEIASGLGQPAGLDYNIENRIVAVPTFEGSEVFFLDIPENYIYPYFTSNVISGHLPLQVSFKDETLSNESITAWKWDFDGDDIIDSELANPTFTFDKIGEYDVSLQIITDSGEESIKMADCISVFDGESSLKFIDNGDHALIPASQHNNLDDSFTIEFCVYPIDWGTSIGTTIFDKNAIKIRLNGYAFGPTGDYSIEIIVKQDDENEVKFTCNNNVIELDKWQHICITYNNMNDLKIFINAVEQELKKIGANEWDKSLIDNIEDDILIGNSKNLSSHLIGNLDEMRLWNFEKSIDQIKLDYDKSLNGDEQGLVGYYNFNEGNGLVLTDITNNLNHGELKSAKYSQGVCYDQISDLEGNYNESNIYRFKLMQNYPNPFNPETVITYQLSTSTDVQLSIFDLLGKEIANLVNSKQISGQYKINFNASGLASGVYIYQLKTDTGILSKKMLFLK